MNQHDRLRRTMFYTTEEGGEYHRLEMPTPAERDKFFYAWKLRHPVGIAYMAAPYMPNQVEGKGGYDFVICKPREPHSTDWPGVDGLVP